MRINAITGNYTRPNFKGIKTIEKGVAKEVLGKDEEIFDTLSDLKGCNVWLLKGGTGGFCNAGSRYTVLISDKASGDMIKEMQTTDDNDEVKKTKDRIEETLIWLKAPSNIIATEDFLKSEVAKNAPERTRQISEKLIKSQMSIEAKTWQAKLNII